MRPKGLSFGHVNLEMFIRYSNGDTEEASRCTGLEFPRVVQTKFGHCQHLDDI